MSKNFSIFISHRWNYANFAIDLKELLNDRGYFFCEYNEVGQHDPIHSENASYVKSKVKSIMSKCDTFIVDASPSSSNSDWIKWEMETAKKLGLKVIGVIPKGYQNTSTVVQDNADTICKWDVEEIVAAIRKHSTL